MHQILRLPSAKCYGRDKSWEAGPKLTPCPVKGSAGHSQFQGHRGRGPPGVAMENILIEALFHSSYQR